MPLDPVSEISSTANSGLVLYEAAGGVERFRRDPGRRKQAGKKGGLAAFAGKGKTKWKKKSVY